MCPARPPKDLGSFNMLDLSPGSIASACSTWSDDRGRAHVTPRLPDWIAWLLLALAPRALLLPINESFYGDAAVRTELAQSWAEAPHWIFSFHDGAFQFGPLHLYLIGALLRLGAEPL